MKWTLRLVVLEIQRIEDARDCESGRLAAESIHLRNLLEGRGGQGEP